MGGGGEGSPGPVQDISHMDMVVRRVGTSTWYGIQYDFAAKWGKHPKGSATKEHCLFGLRNWSGSPASNLMSQLKSTAVSIGAGKYQLDIPKTVEVRTALGGGIEAFSKCGTDGCKQAAIQDLGSSWRLIFSPCPK